VRQKKGGLTYENSKKKPVRAGRVESE